MLQADGECRRQQLWRFQRKDFNARHPGFDHVNHQRAIACIRDREAIGQNGARINPAEIGSVADRREGEVENLQVVESEDSHVGCQHIECLDRFGGQIILIARLKRLYRDLTLPENI